MRALRMRRPKGYAEVTSGPNGTGRYSFTMHWRVLGDDGHYHQRAQCFCAHIEEYRGHVRRWVDKRSPEEKKRCPLPLS